MSFPENLQFIRAQAGVTQEQLAEQLDVTRQSVSKWESGVSFPEMDTLLRICDLYNVNLDTLLRGSVEGSRVSDTARYDAFMNRFALRISLSVSGIIAGMGLSLLMETRHLPESWCSAAFLLVLSVCTVVMVACGLQMEQFQKKHPAIADFYTEENRDAFHQKFIWYISGGVGAILFGLVLMALLESVKTDQALWEGYGVTLFLLIVSGAVWAFVYAGIMHDKYDIAKYNRGCNPSPESKRRQALTGTVCGVLMLLAAAVYVGLGLALDMWRTAWWVFAVAGILCGVAAVVLNPFKEEP